MTSTITGDAKGDGDHRMGSNLGGAPDAVATGSSRGDEVAFAELVERYRHELQVHCYRMLGSFHESEDLVQETLLRAWRGRESFEGRSSRRAWLYRIATNACLDQLKHRRRHALVRPSTAREGGRAERPLTEVSWLEPYPDQLLDQVAPSQSEPDAMIVAKETIELAFLAAIQLLTPHQRAVMILRDVLAWPASDTAAVLETSVASVNSALNRARVALRESLPRRRSEWAPATDPTATERELLQRYMDAHERTDMDALAAILRDDALMTMPPEPSWFQGRDAIAAVLTPVFVPGSPGYLGHLRMRPTRANRQSAAANYIRRPGDSTYRAIGLDVLRIEDGLIAEITSFTAEHFSAFGLPATL